MEFQVINPPRVFALKRLALSTSSQELRLLKKSLKRSLLVTGDPTAVEYLVYDLSSYYPCKLRKVIISENELPIDGSRYLDPQGLNDRAIAYAVRLRPDRIITYDPQPGLLKDLQDFFTVGHQGIVGMPGYSMDEAQEVLMQYSPAPGFEIPALAEAIKYSVQVRDGSPYRIELFKAWQGKGNNHTQKIISPL